MVPISLTTFSGYLKRINSSNWDENQKRFFNFLFPVFGDTREYAEPVMTLHERIHHELVKRLVESLAPLIEGEYDLDQPRRFAGPWLPRSRYFSICRDKYGDDQNTLVHELRAYRDPQRSGMVEIIDLGINKMLVLVIGRDQYKSKRSPEIAVLVHEPQRLPKEFEKLVSQKFRSHEGKYIWMFRFPYTVQELTIENVVDLRLPETRVRFHDYFSRPQEGSSIIWPEQFQTTEEPIVALSRFRLVGGRAPTPNDFYHMLPTLMNPDVGGGRAAYTGSTVQAIGAWMRSHSVSALIYPSARCDVFVEVENGIVRNFGGWNLVDYRLGEFDEKVKMSYFDPSPWCWVTFPKGVSIAVAPPQSRNEGSFSFDGMVNYWAEDYLGLVRSLEVVKSELNIPDTDARNGLETISYYETWKIGIYTARWLQIVVSRKSAEEIRTAILVLKGLGVRHGLLYPLGEIDEIAEDLSDEFDLNRALRACVAMSNKIADHFQKSKKTDHEQIVTVAGNFELLMLYLALGVREQTIPEGAFDIRKFQQLPLSGYLEQRLSTFMKNVAAFLSGKAGDPSKYFFEGQILERDISAYLRNRSTEV